MFRNVDVEPTCKKALSTFNLGSNGFILPPQMSNTVLRCIVDETDLTGIMGNETTSAGSLKFIIDNARMGISAWACESNCFANQPQADLTEGIGQLEIKTESLRHVVCATSDLLADASFNIENWVLQRVSQGFRNTINAAIAVGDGLGKPLGILNPASGIPILDTSESTPPGQWTWQDLIGLKWDLPMMYHGPGSAYLMNQRSFALCLTMSFGNWKLAYMIVTRKATSLLVDLILRAGAHS
jgi:HK97 family phage major capsid protein